MGWDGGLEVAASSLPSPMPADDVVHGCSSTTDVIRENASRNHAKSPLSRDRAASEREGGRYGGKREAGGLLDWEAADGLTDLRRRYAKSIKLQK